MRDALKAKDEPFRWDKYHKFVRTLLQFLQRQEEALVKHAPRVVLCKHLTEVLDVGRETTDSDDTDEQLFHFEEATDQELRKVLLDEETNQQLSLRAAERLLSEFTFLMQIPW